MITQDELLKLLDYNPDTGVFTWKVSTSNRVNVGDIVMSHHNKGYIRISINYIRYLAHRLAWLYVYGYIPFDQIDHIDGNKKNNAIANLREATAKENKQNIRKPQANNASGFLGVYFDTHRGKFMAAIRINCNSKNLGRFNTAEEAYAAYIKAKREIHKFCTI